MLKPGGTVWISEFCVARPVYASEAVLAPITSRSLGLFGIPLVVMHSRTFYLRALTQGGFSDVTHQRVRSPAAKPWHMLTPVIGLPWFKVPRASYPIRPTLFSARKPE